MFSVMRLISFMFVFDTTIISHNASYVNSRLYPARSRGSLVAASDEAETAFHYHLAVIVKLCYAVSIILTKRWMIMKFTAIGRLASHGRSLASKLIPFSMRYSKQFLKDVQEYSESPEICELVRLHAEERLASRPTITREKTLLFYSKNNSKCNLLTVEKNRTKVLTAFKWAASHGIDTFIADYSTAFGLLAFEVLIELRQNGHCFNLYAIMSKPLKERKTYRAIRETNVELFQLATKADIVYTSLDPEIIYDMYTQSGVHCTDRLVFSPRINK